jgi:hypothetical protein
MERVPDECVDNRGPETDGGHRKGTQCSLLGHVYWLNTLPIRQNRILLAKHRRESSTDRRCSTCEDRWSDGTSENLYGSLFCVSLRVDDVGRNSFHATPMGQCYRGLIHWSAILLSGDIRPPMHRGLCGHCMANYLRWQASAGEDGGTRRNDCL